MVITEEQMLQEHYPQIFRKGLALQEFWEQLWLVEIAKLIDQSTF